MVVLASAFPTSPLDSGAGSASMWFPCSGWGFLCRVVAPYAAMGFPRAGPPTSLHPRVQGLGSIHPDVACVAGVGVSSSVCLFVTLALGMEGVRGGKEEGGHDVLLGPPTSWVPLVFLPPQFLRRVHMKWPLWKRVGVAGSVLLRLLGCRCLGPHPSREGRGAWRVFAHDW